MKSTSQRTDNLMPNRHRSLVIAALVMVLGMVVALPSVAVASRSLVLEEGGRVGEYAGGYDDWLWQRPQPEDKQRPPPGDAAVEPATKPRPETPVAGQPQPRKISFAERGELEALPGQIEALEQEQQQLYETLSDPKLYQENGADVARIQARLEEIGKALEAAYERWMFLESLPA